MLDRLIAFAGGNTNICCGHIILEIDKGFGAFSGITAIGYFPGWQRPPALLECFNNRHVGIIAFETGSKCRFGAVTHTVFHRRGQIKIAITGTSVETGFMHA